jgi:sialic acid synthase SpsE
MQLDINGFLIGKPLKPYIIAEIGVNHEGSMELAKRLIREAKEGGAHAAKFQSYKAEKIASKYSPAYWDQSKESTDSQYKLFKKYDAFNDSEYRELAKYCQEVGIDFMSTPFDLEAVDCLAPLMPAFKIASADITNVPLLRKCAQQGKPIILSTGASSFVEVEFAINILKSGGATAIALLHCVLNYPTPEKNAQLSMIRKLAHLFPECVIGYSDHVVPDETMSALEVAVLHGCVILEKHFTHDKTLPGNDHYHAMDKQDLQAFLAKLNKYQVLLSECSDKDLKIEQQAREHARRSIVANGDIEAGEFLTENNLICKRPAHGVSPIYWDEVIGKKAVMNIDDDTPLQWRMFV